VESLAATRSALALVLTRRWRCRCRGFVVTGLAIVAVGVTGGLAVF